MIWYVKLLSNAVPLKRFVCFQMTQASIVLLVMLLTVLTAAKEDYILKDLITQESSAVDNRRVIHNIGETA